MKCIKETNNEKEFVVSTIPLTYCAVESKIKSLFNMHKEDK